MIQVECECGRVIKTKDENAGKKARCPDCSEVVQFPSPRKASSAKPAATSSKPRRKSGPSWKTNSMTVPPKMKTMVMTAKKKPKHRD